MTISILGCGWFGQPLGEALVRQGFVVNGSTTTATKLAVLQQAGINPFLIDLGAQEKNLANTGFFNCDVLVVAIPPRTRQQASDVYIEQMRYLIGLLQTHGVARVIFISATSVYGDCNRTVDERDTPEPDAPAGITLLEAEALFRGQHSFATTIVRFGGLIGPGRDPGKFFAGKTDIPNGLAPVNLIHLDDCIGICMAILDTQWFGHTMNACAPWHPTRMDFYTTASQQAGLQPPAFIPELNAWKVVKSIYHGQPLQYAFKRPV